MSNDARASVVKPSRNGYMFMVFESVVPDETRRRFVCDSLDLDLEQVFFSARQADDTDKNLINEVDPAVVVFSGCSSFAQENGRVSVDLTPKNVEEVRQFVEPYALSDFPQLHLHDEYSLRDGVGTVEQRVELMRERRWTYLTASNHGSLGGWIRQYVTAKKLDLKPVFGVETYVNRFRKQNKEEIADDTGKLRFRKNNHLLLLVRTQEGWFNLIKVHNDAHENGFYYVPRTDDDFLADHGKGLIATTTDAGAGEIPRLLLNDSLPWETRLAQAKERYEFYKSVFDDFYVELNLVRWEQQVDANRALITFGEWVGAKYVITCDCHYLRPEDSETHSVLLMLRDSKTVADKALALAAGAFKRLLGAQSLSVSPESATWAEEKNRPEHKAALQEAVQHGRSYLEQNGYDDAIKAYDELTEKIAKGEDILDPGNEDSVWEFNVKDLYFKDLNDVYATWNELHGKNDPVFTEDLFWRAVRDTRRLVRSVENFNIDTSIKLPKMNENAGQELRQLCFAGLDKLRLSDKQEYRDRLERELVVIDRMGFSDYFLVFKKIVEFCQQHEISLGCGRGSAAGSLISYCLEITRVDPLQFGLLFERFIDDSRVDAPDIDVDFDMRYRHIVKHGLTQLFGDDHVCSVGSYQLMKTRSVIKDVGRVFCLSPAFLNTVTKRLSMTYQDLDDEEGGDDEVSLDKVSWDMLMSQDQTLRDLFGKYKFLEQHCRVLRGQVRNIGKHPAGIIVSSVRLPDWVPVRRHEDELVACWTEGLELRELQAIGLVKYDILGLRTVSIIADALKLISETTVRLSFDGFNPVMLADDSVVTISYNDQFYETRAAELQPGHVIVRLPKPKVKMLNGDELVSYETDELEAVDVPPVTITTVERVKLDLTKVPLDDVTSLRRLNQHDVFGVFQFETPTAVKVIKEIGVDTFDDIYVATTLGRPDPLSGKLHESYGRRKRGEEQWDKIESLPFLSETYSLPIFQESLMQLASHLAGFSGAEANALRKGLAKGKDNEENMRKLKKLLIDFRNRSQDAVKKGDITQEQLDTLIQIVERFGGYSFNKSHGLSYGMMAYWTLFLKTHYPAQFMCTLFNFTDRARIDRGGSSLFTRYVKYAKKRGIVVLPPDINRSRAQFSLEGPNVVRWSMTEVKGIGESAALDVIKHQPYSSFKDFCDKITKRTVNKGKVHALITCGAFDNMGDREVLLKEYYHDVRKEKDTVVAFSKEDRVNAETELLGVCLSSQVLPAFDQQWLTENKIRYIGEAKERQRGLYVGRVKRTTKRKARTSGKEMMIVSLYDDADDVEFFVWTKDIPKCEEVLQNGRLVVVPLRRLDEEGGLCYSGPAENLFELEEKR